MLTAARHGGILANLFQLSHSFGFPLCLLCSNRRHWNRLIRMVPSFASYIIASITVVLSVSAYNFLGDGLRDAADPYR
jgi:hypothetical protein